MMNTNSLRLPKSLHSRIKELAKQEGVSINQFAVTALAEKMSALMTAEYIEERAHRASRQAFEQALTNIGDIEPAPEARL